MSSFTTKTVTAITLSILCFSVSSRAAALAPETLKAWEDYIRVENSRIAGRSPSSPFLWIDESADRQRCVRNGEILTSPVGKNTPKSVPHGLIHHWVGAVFAPDAHLEDVLAVARDYGKYKDYYAPNVLDSQPLHQCDDGNRFSLVMLNKALFSKTALDAEFQESYVRLSAKKWYGVVASTRVQQVDNYGQPDQHKLSPDEGSGYIWRLYSLSRFEERDGGVYVELEAIALSRDIPGSLHWLVNPIVRRVSKGSLEVSLVKTQQAVRSTQSARNATAAGSSMAALRAGNE
jgi:hypothetical protein